MTVPVVYRDTAERVVASFTASDIATGKGYVRYYGVDAEGADYLTVLAIDSSDEKTDQSTSDTSGTPVFLYEKNFDLDFDKTVTMEGICFINYSLQINANSETGTMNSTVKLFHVDSGSSETQLGSTVTTADLTTSTTDVGARYCADIDIPRQTFVEGEKFRVEFRISATKGVGDNPGFILYHDPTGRNNSETGDASTLLVDVPLLIP